MRMLRMSVLPVAVVVGWSRSVCGITAADYVKANAVAPISTATKQSLPPFGVSDADVEDLVQQVIRDPSINIAAIPDALEIQIYRSTIKIVLEALYKLLNTIHGTKIANTSHEIHLKRIPAEPSSQQQKKVQLNYERTSKTITDVSDHVLEDIAKGLLSNQNINQRFLPDLIEKKLYINCLKLIFRLLEMIADSIKITVCAHDLRIAISKASVEEAMEHASLLMAELDRSKLYEMAQSVGGPNDKPRKTWWLSRKKQAFLQTLHASLLALLLAILDDLMHQTCIELFSDRMVLDIVPSASGDPPVTIAERQQSNPPANKPNNPTILRGTHRLITFFTGIVFGMFIVRNETQISEWGEQGISHLLNWLGKIRKTAAEE